MAVTDRPDTKRPDSTKPDSAKRSYRAAVVSLAAAQKPGDGVPAYLRWVNRALGRRAAAAAYVLGLTPNAVTAISMTFSVLAMVLIAVPMTSWLGGVVIAAALLLGYALDSADGQLARLTGSGSRAGEWLDHVVDSARLPAVHLAVAIGFYRRDAFDHDWPSMVALGFMLLSSVWFFAQILAESLESRPRGAGHQPVSVPVWVSFVKIPYDVGSLYLVFLLYSWASGFLALYALLFAITAVVAAGSLVRKYQSLRRPLTNSVDG